MFDFEVTTPKELAAAFLAAAQPTYEDAKNHPVVIRFGTARYTFKEGIHQRRAEELARNARRLRHSQNQ